MNTINRTMLLGVSILLVGASASAAVPSGQTGTVLPMNGNPYSTNSYWAAVGGGIQCTNPNSSGARYVTQRWEVALPIASTGQWYALYMQSVAGWNGYWGESNPTCATMTVFGDKHEAIGVYQRCNYSRTRGNPTYIWDSWLTSKGAVVLDLDIGCGSRAGEYGEVDQLTWVAY